MKIIEKLKSTDLFYYNVPIDIHKTWCGGFMTIVFGAITVFISYYSFYKRYNHRYDLINVY